MSKDAKKILHLKINPSIREYTYQSVESIIYVDIDGYPTVWCAVGHRIKIFDAITWNDEITDMKLENKITCLMHEPINSKIWISVLGNFFYVMDVQTRSFNQKIQIHSDIIICIINFEKIKKVLTASANGEIFVWDANKLEKIDSFNTFQATGKQLKLIDIKTSAKYLLSIYLKQIDIFDEFFQFKETLKFNCGENNELISCACLSHDPDSNEEFLWVGNTANGIVSVWSLKNFELKMRIGVYDCKGYRSFLSVDDLAHNDSIRSLCCVENKFIISGSGSGDGSIAIWRPERIKRKTIAGSINKIWNEF
ncbi:DENN domain-containing 3 isoform X3 [Brachionus plicatilis]|uniref:DENN domain-containing 3 isoform X3 n=1 Tax=Brachionus plicatilis TaxID=10195 RepID=A0A3M7SCW6_BRAPC|nr:DENN domain-containing 3 isoform X3 [Brachionus plicatilis]